MKLAISKLASYNGIEENELDWLKLYYVVLVGLKVFVLILTQQILILEFIKAKFWDLCWLFSLYKKW